MKNKLTKSIAVILVGTSAIALAGSRPDAHAPIGVMGDHVHKKGEWMASFRAMTMEMNQLYRGSDTFSGASGYMVDPTHMTMDMQMLGGMYGVSDQLTLMGMTSYNSYYMDVVNTMSGAESRMKTSGLGDSSLTALYQVYNEARGEGSANVHIGLGVSLPTGDVEKKNAMGRDLPMPMQLGSGTYDLMPSVTYNHFINDEWSWGGQAKGVFHLGRNDSGYSLGDSLNLTSWVARNINSGFSVSGRVNFRAWSGIDGVQTNGIFVMNPMMATTADPDNTGGVRMDLYLGLNYIRHSGVRVATEVGKTVYQDVQGTQLANDWSLNVGLQYAF